MIIEDEERREFRSCCGFLHTSIAYKIIIGYYFLWSTLLAFMPMPFFNLYIGIAGVVLCILALVGLCTNNIQFITVFFYYAVFTIVLLLFLGGYYFFVTIFYKDEIRDSFGSWFDDLFFIIHLMDVLFLLVHYYSLGIISKYRSYVWTHSQKNGKRYDMPSFTMDIFTWISLISGILGMALNLLLIPVILYYSQKSMGRYKYLMLAYTIAAILYTAAQVVTLPTYFLFDSGFVLCSTASHSSTIINMAGLFVFCSTFALVEIIVCLSFLYRYGVMCNERVLQYFKPGLKLVQMLVLSFFSWIVPSLLFAALKPNPLVMEYIDKAENEVREQIINLTCLGGPVFLWSGEIYRPMLYALTGFVVLTLVTIAVDIFCLVKIKRLFRTIAVNSHVKRQKELLTLLLLQLILPIIFNGTPSALMIVFTLLEVNPGAAPQYIGAVMSVAQICDPILVIGFVGNYRRAMYRLVRLKVMKITSVEASGSRLRIDRTSERTRSRTNVA